ncbi:hypothetical protein NQ318_009834 [Aromia moschata]|uniref:Secreted protein n=1 Tax=Aromia moschata TaxID=1265417 RepID=A0AAV8XM14_9CUCU|nr:hypothetical protein NQ318_009834 [Aromia moschata]
MTSAISCYFLCITLLHLRVTLPRRSVFIFFCICIDDVNLNFPTNKNNDLANAWSVKERLKHSATRILKPNDVKKHHRI